MFFLFHREAPLPEEAKTNKPVCYAVQPTLCVDTQALEFVVFSSGLRASLLSRAFLEDVREVSFRPLPPCRHLHLTCTSFYIDSVLNALAHGVVWWLVLIQAWALASRGAVAVGSGDLVVSVASFLAVLMVCPQNPGISVDDGQHVSSILVCHHVLAFVSKFKFRLVHFPFLPGPRRSCGLWARLD